MQKMKAAKSNFNILFYFDTLLFRRNQMQDNQSCLCEYWGEERAIAELGIEAVFFKWLVYSKRLKVYLLGDGNADHVEKRLFAKADIEALKKSFCSLVIETKTCLFLCKRNQ